MNVVAFGAGVNSTAMVILMHRDNGLAHLRPFRVIFVDTGAEHPGTYDHIRTFQDWLQREKIEFTTLKSNYGSIVDYCLNQRLVPSRTSRWCTGKFKIDPMAEHLWNLPEAADETKLNMCIGFASDEVDRAQQNRRVWIRNVFPLIDLDIDREACGRVILEEGISVPRKSGCFMCPFQRHKQWLYLALDHPNLFDTACKMEENGAGFSKGVYLHGTKPLRKHMQEGFACGEDEEREHPCLCGL